MNTIKNYTNAIVVALSLTAIGCADNELAVEPKDNNFPLRLILDAEEGADLADAEDYGLAIKFADFIGDLPATTITIDYEIADLTDDMVGNVSIKEILYEKDDEEYELDFTASPNGLTGTITWNDPTSNELPEEIEVVFELPGEEDVFFAEGGFTFSISNVLANGANVLLGTPNSFEYEVLDHELAGSWKLEIDNAEDFDALKEALGSLNPDLDAMEFADVKTGEVIEVEIEFGFEEAELKLVFINEDDEEVEIEIEFEYDFEDGEIELTGGRLILGDDGEIEGELDFIGEAEYELDGDELTITLFKLIDEDNYEEGEELFASTTGFTLTFEKD